MHFCIILIKSETKKLFSTQNEQKTQHIKIIFEE